VALYKLDKILKYGKLGEAQFDDLARWSKNDMKGNRKGKKRRYIMVLTLSSLCLALYIKAV
jgi:hypothetical protein